MNYEQLFDPTYRLLLLLLLMSEAAVIIIGNKNIFVRHIIIMPQSNNFISAFDDV